ncbi:MAG: AAA family ATPase [Armatimonadetes bacterium]|nr:AAA family ATPase [Armatimonadota bacterium]MDE2206021.1 AAA family ATPase [Armatimonadota bacterium]
MTAIDDIDPEAEQRSVSVAVVCAAIRQEAHRALVAQDELLDSLLIALLARGHVLVEGPPGVAKTLAVRVLARCLGLSFGRIQFTPDLMPADVLGSSIYDQAAGTFRFRPGPLFASLILADEINRTPPRTQSALLEAMEERHVTADGVVHHLGEFFMVCATQNPIEFEGTYPLPEAQLDRFLLKIKVDYPSEADECILLDRVRDGFRADVLDAVGLRRVAGETELAACRAEVDRVLVSDDICRYIAQLVRSTREHPKTMLGASPRAAVLMLHAVRASAAMRGIQFATPDDVKRVALPLMRHRLLIDPDAELDGVTPDAVISELLASVPVPR